MTGQLTGDSTLIAMALAANLVALAAAVAELRQAQQRTAQAAAARDAATRLQAACARDRSAQLRQHGVIGRQPSKAKTVGTLAQSDTPVPARLRPSLSSAGIRSRADRGRGRRPPRAGVGR